MPFLESCEKSPTKSFRFLCQKRESKSMLWKIEAKSFILEGIHSFYFAARFEELGVCLNLML